MNPSSGNPGMNKLARALQGRMQQNVDASSYLLLDFGEIQGDYSLLTNTYPIPIPRSDYLVCRQLTLGSTGSHLTNTSPNGSHEHTGEGTHNHDGGVHDGHETGTGTHNHSGGVHGHGNAGSHLHSVLIPEKMRSILPGDRVLVAWIQNDAVVIDIVLPASAI